jgi:hypothetical protein
MKGGSEMKVIVMVVRDEFEEEEMFERLDIEDMVVVSSNVNRELYEKIVTTLMV